ncbi:DUF6597 domain-containing transcriptional factor [Mucilaginibacter terrae]|uniref:DUF6597 domain-containing transcriptional factor n=1 Tax=Mucilaginibacter terrae TaxID=1955052 RepID=UPI00363FFF69
MKYYTIPPPPSLKQFVRCFWVLEHDLSYAETEYVYRSIADGCAELVFHYRGLFNDIIGDEQVRGWQSGLHAQSTRYRRFITTQSFGLFGAYIYPFALPQLLNMPACELSNHTPDLNTLFKAAGRELEEQMMLAVNNQERAQILSAFLEQRLLNKPVKDEHIIQSVAYVIHSRPQLTVAQLANKFCLSTRQFDRKFKANSGFSPKTYLRLMRLRSALDNYGTHKSLGQIAQECGYYDQSHFIHDVQTFTGYNPSHYFSGMAEGTEYKNF